MTRTPVSTTSHVEHRFIARHPDGTVHFGKWTTRSTAEYEGADYAKEWLRTIKRLGLEGQKVKIEMQTKTVETRTFLSRPVMSGEYSQLITDHYGNFRSMS